MRSVLLLGEKELPETWPFNMVTPVAGVSLPLGRADVDIGKKVVVVNEGYLVEYGM